MDRQDGGEVSPSRPPHLLSSHPLAARRRAEGLRMDELLREEKRRLSSMRRRREERDDRENL